MPASRARVERVYPFVLEERAADEPPRISGHAAVFNALSEDLGGFRETIRRGAFAKTVAEADVRFLFNHDPSYVLGRTKSGTLGLAEDQHGLRVAGDPPETSWAQDLLVSMRRRDIDQMSFAFSVVQEGKMRSQTADERLQTGDDLPVRQLLEVKLFDVSVVTFPAYPQTDVAARSALARMGIDFDLLAASVDRHERGITLVRDDVETIRGALSALSALLPSEPVETTTPPADEPAPLAVSLGLWRQRLLLAEHRPTV